MRQQTLGRKPQNQWFHIFNTDTVTIKKGAPCVLDSAAAQSTKFGFGVKSIESLAAAEQGLFMGLATQDIATKTEGDTVAGYVTNARVLRQSRAASTDVWLSTTAIAVGDVLAMLTAVGVQCLSRSAAGSAFTNIMPVIAFETAASITTIASSSTAGADTSLLYSTSILKVFVSFL